jgi:hypothetical protein
MRECVGWLVACLLACLVFVIVFVLSCIVTLLLCSVAKAMQAKEKVMDTAPTAVRNNGYYAKPVGFDACCHTPWMSF